MAPETPIGVNGEVGVRCGVVEVEADVAGVGEQESLGITASPMATGCLVTGVPLCLGSAAPDAAVVMVIPEGLGASDAR